MSELIENMKKISSLMSGMQKRYWDEKISIAKEIRMTPLSEIFTPREIKRIINTVNPEVKQCFRNAQRFCVFCSVGLGHDVQYIEGEWEVVDGLGIEHAFNCIDGKYIDITAELALGKDVTKESYIAIAHLKPAEVREQMMKRKVYDALMPQWVGNRIMNKDK